MDKTNITFSRGKTKIGLDVNEDELRELYLLVKENEILSPINRILKFLVDTLPEQVKE